MTARLRQPVALALAAALLLPVLSGCGGSDKKGQPVPRAEAAAIVARLQEAKRRNSPLRCNDLKHDTVPALKAQVGSLPPATDAAVRQTLSDGIDHLNDLVDQACSSQQTTTETTPSETTTQSTPSTTESTPSTETTNTNTNTNTNTTPTNTNTNTTPTNTGPSGGTPSPGGATSGGKGNGNGGGG